MGLKRLQHGKDDNQQQNDGGYFIKPAIPHVRACVAALFEFGEQATAAMVKSNQHRHQCEF